MKYVGKREPILFVVMIIFAFLIHMSYILNGFTWLDHRDIEERHAIVPLIQLPSTFLTRYGDTGFYRPMVTLINSIDYEVYGNVAPGYHATNIVLLLAIIAVVPNFLRAFFGVSFIDGIFAALIISIHPYGFLPVGSISYRPELLFTLFSLLSVFYYVKSRTTNSMQTKLLSAFLFFCALLSKETALIIVPGAVIVWETSQLQLSLRAKRSAAKQSQRKPPYIQIASFLAMTTMYTVLRLHAVPEIWRISSKFPSLSTAIGTRLLIVGKLLIGFLSPFLPSISDATPILGLPNLFVLFTLGIIFFLCSTAIRSGMHKPIGKALWLLLLCITPALNIVPLPRMSSPHYGFIALVPFSILIVILTKKHPILKIVVCIWIIIAGVIMATNGSRFRTDKTLFLPEIAKDKYFLEGYFYLGNYYLSEKNYSLAEKMYTAASKSTTNVHAYSEPDTIVTNLAAVKFAQKDYTTADQLLASIQKNPSKQKNIVILYNRALIARKQRNFLKVVALLSHYHQHNPLAMLLLADAYHNLHENDQAKKILQQSLPYWPMDQKTQIERLINNISALNFLDNPTF